MHTHSKNHIKNCLLSSYVHHYSMLTTHTITFELYFLYSKQHVAFTDRFSQFQSRWECASKIIASTSVRKNIFLTAEIAGKGNLISWQALQYFLMSTWMSFKTRDWLKVFKDVGGVYLWLHFYGFHNLWKYN